MLERLIEYINGHSGTRWPTLDEIAVDFFKRFPRTPDTHAGRVGA